MTIKSILCPLDFSSQSRLVLRTALAVAAGEDARVTVVHVIDPLLAQASAMALEKPTLKQSVLTDLRTLVGEVTHELGVQPETVSISIHFGEPHDVILEEIEKAAPDLVVMGTQGYSGVRKAFFGSTAARVLAKSTRPVLAVPPQGFTSGRADTTTTTTTTNNTPPLGLERIVVAVDFSEASMRAIETSADLARKWGLALVLVHIVPQAPAIERWSAMLGDYHSRQTDRARRELELIAREIGGVPVTVISTTGRPEDAIAEIANREPGGIIALGVQAKGRGRTAFQLGSTAYRLLCQTERPVLIFPVAAVDKSLAPNATTAVSPTT